MATDQSGNLSDCGPPGPLLDKSPLTPLASPVSGPLLDVHSGKVNFSLEARSLRRLSDEYPEVVPNGPHFQFPGQGQFAGPSVAKRANAFLLDALFCFDLPQILRRRPIG